MAIEDSRGDAPAREDADRIGLAVLALCIASSLLTLGVWFAVEIKTPEPGRTAESARELTLGTAAAEQAIYP